MSVKDLFELCKNYGSHVRKLTLYNFDNNLETIDGLKLWQPVKKLLNDSDLICDGWKITRKIDDCREINDINYIYDYVHEILDIKGGDEDSDECGDERYKWKKFHFFLQTIRIPKLNPICTLLRICQIGYNLGQLSEHYHDYEPNAIEFFELNKLNEIESYIDLDCELEIDREIIETIKSMIRNIIETIDRIKFTKKYLKYKNKYFQIKQ